MEEFKNAAESNWGPKFDPETCNALLQVHTPHHALERMRTVADTEELLQKSEFHSTIIGRETGDEILHELAEMSDEERIDMMGKIASLIKEYKWSYAPVDEYYLISKFYEEGDERRSVIQIIEVPELEDFYKKLNQILGTSFPVPFPHITLYTTSTRPDKKLRGIGIYSRDQFASLNPRKLD